MFAVVDVGGGIEGFTAISSGVPFWQVLPSSASNN